MPFAALATDYDGTLAHDGHVDDATVGALGRWRDSGRRLVLVTGRVLPELVPLFPALDWFDRVVAENGAVFYRPASREEVLLAQPPPDAFVEALRARGVKPLSVGRVIVATDEPNEAVARETIREMGLELQVIFNKGAVMVLPAGINKASGLAACLNELGLLPENVVAVGDAQNDRAFLEMCGYGVAVANALPGLKEQADWVTRGSRGAGVAELIDRLLGDDRASLGPV